MRRFMLLCVLSLCAPLVGAPTTAAIAAKGDGNHHAVTEIGPNSFRIKKATFDKYAHDLSKAATLAHAEPHHVKGGVNGWTLSGISKGGLAHAAGLHNGDRVTKINGKALKGMPGVAFTLESLRHKTNFTVKLVRRDGRKVTLKYQVRRVRRRRPELGSAPRSAGAQHIPSERMR